MARPHWRYDSDLAPWYRELDTITFEALCYLCLRAFDHLLTIVGVSRGLASIINYLQKQPSIFTSSNPHLSLITSHIFE